MPASLFRIAADIPARVREQLLQRFPPRFDQVYAVSITLAYRVPDTFSFNPNPQEACVYGIHRADQHEALLVRLGEEEWQAIEPKPLHLTLSTAPDVPPATAGQIEMKRVLLLPQPIPFTAQLAAFPLWNLARHAGRRSVAA